MLSRGPGHFRWELVIGTFGCSWCQLSAWVRSRRLEWWNIGMVNIPVLHRFANGFEKREIAMNGIYFLAWLSFSVLLSACASVRGPGDLNAGRHALINGNYQAAVSDFEAAEQLSPNYIYGGELREGVLSS